MGLDWPRRWFEPGSPERRGDRLPSVGALSVEHGVSLSTVQQAYRGLEDSGLATPKPKSGYFVLMG
ncbi:GntR family transcriptional regulator, partial [Pseudomonas frederiksbergensis]|uniref:GntR family transcriptional regulator n=1 Tax=Pseudomonas frederiksbergensis TaxID=104087 RepID=UPI00160EE498